MTPRSRQTAVPADQAAGLRRWQSHRPLQLIYCMNDSAPCAVPMARALRKQGLHPLVIDTRDRLFGETAAQTLFDWRVQLERDQLLALPLADVVGWHAPGLCVHTPGLARATRHFDVLVFDCVLTDVTHPPVHAREWALLAVHPETAQSVYALLKTRAASGALASILTGDPASCERVREACAHFLGASAAAAVRCLHGGVDAIAALAVRMAHDEPGCPPRYKTGHP